jgi:hypothetical protein
MVVGVGAYLLYRHSKAPAPISSGPQANDASTTNTIKTSTYNTLKALGVTVTQAQPVMLWNDGYKRATGKDAPALFAGKPTNQLVTFDDWWTAMIRAGIQ